MDSKVDSRAAKLQAVRQRQIGRKAGRSAGWQVSRWAGI